MQHLTYDLRAFATANDVNGVVTISHDELDILLDRIDRAHHDEIERYTSEASARIDKAYVEGHDKGLDDAKLYACDNMIYLPLDIDGEPIRVGDVMESGIVTAMAIENDGRWSVSFDEYGYFDDMCYPASQRHLNIDNKTDILETYHRIMNRPAMEGSPQYLLDAITKYFAKLLDNCEKENDDE